MYKALIFILLCMAGCMTAYGQTPANSKIFLEVSDSSVVDREGNRTYSIPASQRSITNHNSSVYLDDSILFFVYDSLRTDGLATVVTVYETDADSIVGLWQIGSGANRALWLNSHRASYEDFSIRYRSETEKGTVIHTMTYKYPETDSTYDGHDTLFIGREGNTGGGKNFCALYYYSGHPDWKVLREKESALAIRYGALLHGSYINSQGDTLWDPLDTDAPYSHGVCGIGRDDSLMLQQPISTVRGDMLSIGAAFPLDNLTHVMMGHDGGTPEFGNRIVSIDTVPYAVLDRHWKVRSHGHGTAVQIRVGADLPLPTDGVRLMLESGGETEIVLPAMSDGIVFDSITLRDGKDYTISLLANPASLPGGGKGARNCKKGRDNGDGLQLTVLPNPSTGRYTAEISQRHEDIVVLEVQDAAGRTVDRHVSSGKHTQYTYSGESSAAGVYYVTVSSNGLRKTAKIVVTK